jgi:hypothetical protein
MIDSTYLDDVMDSRDIQDRIDEIEEIKELDGETHDEQDELETLIAIRTASEDFGWEWGINFIHENYIRQYVEDFCEEVGWIQRDQYFPYNHIDWDAATEEFLMDYSEVEIDGITMYFREA